MNKRSWSTDDRNEYDALIERALREPVVADRRDILLRGLDRALSHHTCVPTRCWAWDVNYQIRNDSADRILKSEAAARKPRVAVSYNGLVLGKAPREMGRTTRDEVGETVYQRALFDFMTFDELRQKRADFARIEKAATVDRTAIEKLLTLEDMVPGALTPAEACERLGVTVEDFLKTG